MAKSLIVTGRTALIGTLYDSAILASAIVVPVEAETRPFCVHSLRSEDLSFFEFFIETARHAQGKKADGSEDEQLQFHLWKFFEQFPHQEYNCIGCNHSENTTGKLESHKIRDSNMVCTKSTHDCA